LHDIKESHAGKYKKIDLSW